MRDISAGWIVGGLLILTPLAAEAQDRSRARDSSLQLQGAWRSGALQRGFRSSDVLSNTASGRERERDGSGVTPNLRQTPADIDLTRRIRRAVLEDESLSTYAHNVKIIANNGQVTLRGPVRTTEEKVALEEKASLIIGRENVRNEVEVAPGYGR